MNLHGIVASQIEAVNPPTFVTVRISTGQAQTAANGQRAPQYATPGAFTGAIAADVLTASAVASGVLQPGQTLAGAGLLARTLITEQLTGTSGGVGTYRLNQVYTAPVTDEAMTTSLILRAQVQPLTWRDIQQLDGLNIQGERRKIYLFGEVNGLIRPQRKGGDLITIADGVNAGVWLVAQTLEQFPDWVSAACTLQNE